MPLFGHSEAGQARKPARLAVLLGRLRQGDGSARNELLKGYAPFALSVASRVIGRFVKLGEDDESTVALIALDEAAKAFDPERGNFLGFARQVIRRRIIDHLRRQSRASREIPAGAMRPAWEQDEDGAAGALQPLDRAIAELAAREHEEGEARHHEVLAFVEELKQYGIELDELERVAPRHQDARDNVTRVARRLVANPELCQYLFRRRQLPLRELESMDGLGRKSLERHRKYIIALALIMAGDYEYLAGYLRADTGEG
jgi:RNA polymerase sigma factor